MASVSTPKNTIKDSHRYVAQGSDPPRRTSYNDDDQGCFFAGTKMNDE